MAFKRREEPSIEAEREALREQRVALDDLKRQLAERVEAVRERERELQQAIAQAGGSSARPSAPSPLPPTPARDGSAAAATVAGADGRGAPGDDALVAREQALAERERRIVALEADVVRREQELQDGHIRLEARERELAEQLERGAAAPVVPAAANGASPDEERLAQIDARLVELREAESLFLRTREELAARSEAVAARERLVAQKERELDEREDGWGAVGMSDMEARLRRLEQQQSAPGGQTASFTGGLRKLQEGSRKPRDA